MYIYSLNEEYKKLNHKTLFVTLKFFGLFKQRKIIKLSKTKLMLKSIKVFNLPVGR